MYIFSAIFSFIIAAVGFHYAVYSSAALRLGEIENAAINRRRIFLRRFSGMMLIATGACLFLLFSSLQQEWSPILIGLLLIATMLLMFGAGWLALVDLRMTNQLRRSLRDKSSDLRNDREGQ